MREWGGGRTLNAHLSAVALAKVERLMSPDRSDGSEGTVGTVGTEPILAFTNLRIRALFGGKLL